MDSKSLRVPKSPETFSGHLRFQHRAFVLLSIDFQTFINTHRTFLGAVHGAPLKIEIVTVSTTRARRRENEGSKSRNAARRSL